jgi:hypothetical protein
MSKSQCNASPVCFIYFTNYVCKSYNIYMGILDMTILSCPNAFIFSYSSPARKSSAMASIREVRRSLGNWFMVTCVLSSSILGSMVVMQTFSNIFLSIPNWSYTLFCCSSCFLATSSHISSMLSHILYPIISISSFIKI